jgi:hypothetical protein
MVNPAGNGAPSASGNSHAPGYILKLIWIFVLFLFSCVLIMNTSTCSAITFSLLYIMIFLLNYGIKICRMLIFLTGGSLSGLRKIIAWLRLWLLYLA